MRDNRIDDLLNRLAGRLPEVDPRQLDHAAASIHSGLHAVRPLPAPWRWVAGLIAICVAVAVVGAIALGPRGIQKMDVLQIGVVFPVLAILIAVAATLAAAEMLPGARRPLPPGLLSVLGCIALATAFGLLFSAVPTERFVAQGMTCLTAGLLHAVPVAIATAFLLHRGFAVSPVAAWFAKGTLAGLAGVTMLELHCVNFEPAHLLVWHIAVLPLGGLIGVLAAWILSRTRSSLQ